MSRPSPGLPTPGGRGRVIRRTLLALVLVLGGVLLLAGARLRSVEQDLRAAQDDLETAGDQLEAGQLGQAQTSLSAAQVHLTAATGGLYNRAELDVVGSLPVLSANLDELRDSVAVASELTAGGVRILRAATPLQGEGGSLEVPLSDGAIPVDAVKAVEAEAQQLAGLLPGSDDDGDAAFVVGPVARLHDRVLHEAVRRRAQLDVLSRGLELVVDMSGGNGDRRYLIAVANTAEMRGSGGMVLSYGTLVGHAGDFELEEFGRIDELRNDKAIQRDAVPTVPDDYLRRWDGFDPLLRWRNATLAGDFEVTAPVLEQMYLLATGHRADGVIQIDPEGLAAILRGTGPVQVPELGTVDADNVVDLVLNRAYLQLPDIDQRSDVLGDVAEAAFTKLVEGEYDGLRPLADALLEGVAGRHVMMSTVAGSTQEQLTYFDADGALPDPTGPDSVYFAAQNLSGNKLDYYVDTSLDLTGEREVGALGTMTATITLTNTAPVGATQPAYVFGPFDASQQAGTYRSAVSLYLPAGTSLLGTSGDPTRAAPVAQQEDGRPVIGFTVDVPAGQSRRVVLQLQLPPRSSSPYTLTVVPSPRVRPTTVHVDLTGGRGVSGQVTADRTWIFRAGLEPAAVRPGVTTDPG